MTSLMLPWLAARNAYAAWRRRIAERREFEQLGPEGWRDLGVSRSEFESYSVEWRSRRTPTYRRVPR